MQPDGGFGGIFFGWFLLNFRNRVRVVLVKFTSKLCLNLGLNLSWNSAKIRLSLGFPDPFLTNNPNPNPVFKKKMPCHTTLCLWRGAWKQKANLGSGPLVEFRGGSESLGHSINGIPVGDKWQLEAATYFWKTHVGWKTWINGHIRNFLSKENTSPEEKKQKKH